MDLRIGVIGTGAIGREHIDRLGGRLSGCMVTAVADINEEAARAIAGKYQAKFYQKGEDLIADSDVDAVVVTSWDEAHAGYVLASVKAGKYVFCEKPLAAKTEECEAILKAEQSFGKRIVQVGFMRRYDHGYLALKEQLQRGIIGEPLMIHACHRNMTHASTMTSDMSIKNAGIHEIDIFRWLLEDEYETGQVILPRQNGFSAKEGLQDPQIMLLRTKKGIAIDVEISQSSGYGYDIQCEVVGELGTLRLPMPEATVMKAAGACSYAVEPGWETRFTGAYDRELETWVREVKKDAITGPSAWDGYIACLTAEALGRCREEGVSKSLGAPVCPDFYL